MPYVEKGNKRYILLHPPKTGGTSLMHTFIAHGYKVWLHSGLIFEVDGIGYAPQHFTPAILKKLMPYHGFKKVLTVRNPYDRVLSEYAWLQRHTGLKQPFKIWYHKFYINPKTDHQLPQSAWHDKDAVIIRCEHFTQDVKNKLGLKKSAFKNKSTMQKPVISDAIRSDINQRFSKDFKLFGYEIRR